MFSSLKDRILKSDFLKSVAVLFSGNVIANFISFISIPIISRIYSEEAFGDYAIMTSTAAIIQGIVVLGLTSAIMVPKSNLEARRVFSVVFLIVLFLDTLFLGVLLIVSPSYRLYDISGSYTLSLGLLYFYIVSYGLFSILTVYVNKQKMNRVLFWNALINSLAMLFFTIPLGLLDYGCFGFLIAAIVGYLFADIQMIYHADPFIKVSLKDFTTVFKNYKDFIYFQYPANLLSTFSVQLPNQLFSNCYGNVQLGAYAMCERILGVPMRLIGAPINTVYFRHSTLLYNEGKDLSSFTYKLVTRIFLVAFVPVVFFCFASERLFAFILGDSWYKVGIIVSILIVPYLFTFVSNCISYCLVVINKQRINLIIAMMQVSLIFSSICFGYWMDFSFTNTIKLFSIASVIVQLANLLLIFYFLEKHFIRFLRFIFCYSTLLSFCYILS